MLAWIDLETTGLVASEHAVLEVAAIVTDDLLQEVDRFHRVVYWSPARLLDHLRADSPEDQFALAAVSTKIDRVVIDLHVKSGLWTEAASSMHALADVDDQFANFIEQTSVGPDGQKAQIAGSSIWLDRSFMAASLPRTLRQLHYRCLDVTTLNELSRRFWPQLLQGAPCKRDFHRAMPDIEDSLALCRYYASQHWAASVPINNGGACYDISIPGEPRVERLVALEVHPVSFVRTDAPTSSIAWRPNWRGK